MKRVAIYFWAVCALAIGLYATFAWAGERYMGTITSPNFYTAGSVSNATTANQFAIPAMSKITLDCDAAAYVLTDVPRGPALAYFDPADGGAFQYDGGYLDADGGLGLQGGVTSSNGLYLAAHTLLPTSVGVNTVVLGGIPSAIVSVVAVSGTVNCKVFDRTGRE